MTNNEFIPEQNNNGNDLSMVYKHLRKFLLKCGFNPYLTGFDYLTDAVMMCYDDDSLLKLKTKILYPEIAKKYNVQKHCVERNIRTLLVAAWSNSRKVNFCRETNYHCFMKNNKEPTCGEAINILESYLKSIFYDT